MFDIVKYIDRKPAIRAPKATPKDSIAVSITDLSFFSTFKSSNKKLFSALKKVLSENSIR